MRRLFSGLVAPLLALALLSSCSDSETSSADDDPSTSSSSSTSAEEPSEEATPTEEPSEDALTEPTTDPATAAGAGTKYCTLLSTDFASLFASIQGPEDVAKAVDLIQQISAEAPAEVDSEWGRMRSALKPLSQAAKLQKRAEAGKVTPKQLQKKTAKLTKDMKDLDTQANAEARDVVAKHATDYCGVTLG